MMCQRSNGTKITPIEREDAVGLVFRGQYDVDRVGKVQA